MSAANAALTDGSARRRSLVFTDLRPMNAHSLRETAAVASAEQTRGKAADVRTDTLNKGRNTTELM